ncbi:hypothetical protein BOX15_Mlig031931g1 [Macrostomum lignano]|uniref:phosphatidylinositol-3,5-bisphosphate 3-phosphatase n=2 Tax=Macrostomum lignano TaxID=282301 RepID=A0A267GWX6_9PLAT|nr:hypothetical protein BOX15_Mlig031931g1 [Macrostomum lignano]
MSNEDPVGQGHEDKELTEMPPSPTMTSSVTTLNGSIHEQEEPDNSIRARNGSIIIDQHQQLSAHELQDALNRVRTLSSCPSVSSCGTAPEEILSIMPQPDEEQDVDRADDVDDADDGARDETGAKLLPADSLLPGERYCCSGLDSTGLLIVLTNYRLLLLRQPPADVESAASTSGQMEPAELRLIESLPVFLIERLQALDGLQLQLHCKDGRCNLPRLYFDSLPELNQWAERLDPTRLSPLLDCQGATYFPYLFKKTIRRRQQQQADAEPVDMGYSAHYTEKSFIEEAKRLGFLGDNSGWCVTKLNSDRSLCQSYPRLHLLPASVTEDELRQSSGYRALGRFPAPVWRCRANGAVLARSAQPLVGLAGFLGWRCEPDEKLVRMLTSDAAKKVLIVDARHYTAALGNGTRGGGYERPEYYTGTEIEYLGLPNIHAIRNSFAALRAALGAACCGRDGSLASVASNSFSSNSSASATTVTYSSYASGNNGSASTVATATTEALQASSATSVGNYSTVSLAPAPAAPVCTAPPTSTTSSGVSSATAAAAAAAAAAQNASFLSDIERAGWLTLLSSLIRHSSRIAQVLVSEGRSVLVHCSDGWDRTPQLTSLCQLIADPYYRSIAGFRLLINREWFEFGHKFADRCSGRDANERSPIFLQFLDCVHQLLLQYPTQFEFTDALLRRLAVHCYSGLFISFLSNGPAERDAADLKSRGLCVWNILKLAGIKNELYQPSHRVLTPSAAIHSLQLWRALYAPPGQPGSFDRLDWDGLPLACDPFQDQLRQLRRELSQAERTRRYLQERLDAQAAAAAAEGEQQQQRQSGGPGNASSRCRSSASSSLSEPSMESAEFVDNCDEGGIVRWVPDHLRHTCANCHASFNQLLRRHHCRACGDVFCYRCCDQYMSLPQQFLRDKCRVCQACFARLSNGADA